MANIYWRLQQKTTHAAEALNKFINQFREKPGFAALVGATTDQIQELEDTIWDLYGTFSIDDATGLYLDRIGALLGQPRLGLSDEDYRIWLKARQRVNASNGTAAALLDILFTLDPDATFDYDTYPPASYSITMYGTDLTPEVLADILSEAQPAGVSGMFAYTTAPETAVFEFSATGAIDATTPDMGFGDSGDPDVGGFLTDIVIL